MSLVENLINQISTNGLGGINSPKNFDLEDDTFAKLLEKQMNSANNALNQPNLFGEMGIPAGLVIEPYEAVDFSNTVQDQMEAVNFKTKSEPVMDVNIEIKEIDMSDCFTNLLKTASNNNSDFLNFAKKHASNAYNVFGKNYISDAIDFADDLKSRL